MTISNPKTAHKGKDVEEDNRTRAHKNTACYICNT